jgi:pilus assembly protein Flp/PilA
VWLYSARVNGFPQVGFCRLNKSRIPAEKAFDSGLKLIGGRCNLFSDNQSCDSKKREPKKNQHSSLRKETIMLFAPKEQGQGLIEYAIILSLVALIVIAVLWLLGPEVGNSYSSINSSIP